MATPKYFPTNEAGTTYLVELDYGRGQTFFTESDSRLNESAALDLIHATDTKVSRVIALRLAEGTLRDVTKEFGDMLFHTLASAADPDFTTMAANVRSLCERAGYDVDGEIRAYELRDAKWLAHVKASGLSRAMNL